MSKFKALSSAFLAASVICGAFPFAVTASSEEKNVRLIVENHTLTSENGADWEGILVDEWVPVGTDFDALSIVKNTLAEKELGSVISDSGYISEINGLSSEDGGSMGAWMVMLDDWVTDEGITAYTSASGKLLPGDEIKLSYSTSWGADLGYDWSGTSTLLSDVKINGGIIDPAFSAETKEYRITSETGKISFVPTAENKAFRWKIYKNEYTPEAPGSDIKSCEDITCDDGDVVYIGVGNKAWHSYLAEGVNETVYKFIINSDNQISESSEGSDQVSSPEASSDTSKVNEDISVDEILDQMSAAIISKGSFAIGNEWEIMTLARLDRINAEQKKLYTESVRSYLAENKINTATDCSRLIIALTALGEDASDFYGTDLTAMLADHDFISAQGLNASVYALIALDTANYDVPVRSDIKTQTTKEMLISDILSAQLQDGGWTFFGDVYDPDMTGMALTALAPYAATDDRVSKAAEKAVTLLGNVQSSNGTYSSFGAENAESCAQVLTALCSLGIDADKDERFTKNGNSLVDALKSFYNKNEKGFSHVIEGDVNTYSSDQAYYALCAYKRLSLKKTTLYDMSDLKPSEQESSLNSTDDSSIESRTEEKSSDSSTESIAQNSGSEKDNASYSTGDNTLLWAFAVMLMLSAVIVIAASKRKE